VVANRHGLAKLIGELLSFLLEVIIGSSGFLGIVFVRALRFFQVNSLEDLNQLVFVSFNLLGCHIALGLGLLSLLDNQVEDLRELAVEVEAPLLELVDYELNVDLELGA